MYYLKDDNGNKSLTTTLIWVGVATASIKLVLSGGKFWGMEFGAFSGTDYALVVGPFLALLAHKRQVVAAQAKKAAKANLASDN